MTCTKALPCSSSCAASVSSRPCPALVAPTSASARVSPASGAPPTPSATSRTARCATGLSRNARRTAPRYSNGPASTAKLQGETKLRAKGTREPLPPLKAEASVEKSDMALILYPTARNRAAAPAASRPPAAHPPRLHVNRKAPQPPGGGGHQAEKSARSRPCPNRPPPSSSTARSPSSPTGRSEEHTSELQSREK